MLWLLPIFLCAHLALTLTVYFLSSDGGAPDRRTLRELQLFQAIKQEELSEVCRLIDIGVDLNARAENGDTALHAAFQTAVPELFVECLVDRGAKVNMEDLDGNTPLHIACESGDLWTVQFLLDHDADVKRRNQWEATPLFSAVKGFRKNFFTVLPLLLARGADPRACTTDGRSLLHVAAQCNNTQAIDLLLRRGLPIDARSNSGMTPLMAAANGAKLDSLKLLLARGANMNLADFQGRTALHHTIAYTPKLAAALLAAGATVNLRDKRGKTPYHEALLYGQPAIKNLLRAHGGRE